MQKIYLLLIILFSSVNISAQNYTSYFTGNTENITTIPQGGVCLMGGATEDDAAMRWFLQRSNGGDILVLRATGSNGYNNYLFSSLGVAVNSVETIVCNNAAASGESYIKQKIQQAEAIWFAGGDQWTYISYWRNTPVDSLINDAVTNRHIVIGGTSAGMAILGGFYFSAQNGTVTSSAALANPHAGNVTVDSARFIKNDFLTDVITDTHYDNPDRRGRQTTFLARIKKDWNLSAKGIACDEYTAVCIDNAGMARVYGGYPAYNDNAYFIQGNCEVNNNVPETCVAGSPLTWNQNNQALKVYNIKGTSTGSNTFNLNDWKTGVGGAWQKWYVINGAWQSAATVAPVCTELPVKIVSFTVAQNKEAVSIRWQTSNELNNSHFNVQRSGDGAHFETILKINAHTGSEPVHQYATIDATPLNGIAFYRLQQMDVDGRFQYSEIKKIGITRVTTLNIYPNPCNTKIIYIEDNSHLLQKIALFNSKGQKVFEKKNVAPKSLHSCDVSNLPKGLYFVQLYGIMGDSLKQLKLVIE